LTLEAILEILVEMIVTLLFGFPGAFFRWIFFRKGRTFWQLYREDPFENGAVGIFIFVLALTVFVLFWTAKW